MEDYYQTYKSFFKRPTKNLAIYKDLKDLIEANTRLDENKEETNRYFQAECFVQNCDDIEKFFSELNEIRNFLDENLVKKRLI